MEPPENQSKHLITAVFHPISENKNIGGHSKEYVNQMWSNSFHHFQFYREFQLQKKRHRQNVFEHQFHPTFLG